MHEAMNSCMNDGEQFEIVLVRRQTDQQHSVFQQVLTGTFKQYMILS